MTLTFTPHLQSMLICFPLDPDFDEVPDFDREPQTQNSNSDEYLQRIRVCVRKRPLSKKEALKGEKDIVDVLLGQWTTLGSGSACAT